MKYGKTLLLILAIGLCGTLSAQHNHGLPLASDTVVPAGTVAIDSLGFDSVYAPLAAIEESEKEADAINPADIIFGHIVDVHSWHLFDYKTVDKETGDTIEHAVAIPLPIILINDGHIDMFWSSKFHHGHADYKGYRLVGGGADKEEIVCVDDEGNVLKDAEGNIVKPIDLSISKIPAAIIIICILLVVFVMIAKNGYKKRENQAPKGIQSIVEMLVVFVRDSIVRPMIGDKHYEKYLPYMLTLFFFIFFSNIMGLIPFFPAGANVTGNIAVTGILAFITFFITNLSGNKHYWVDIFNTPGVPAWLKIFPLMPLIEVVGVFTKPIVLMIRLFANMTAGHIVVLGLIIIIFIMSNAISMGVGGAMSVISVLFSVFISVLECLVAYIQAFVFTMLSSLYIGMAVAEPHHAEA